jgi:predicted esterase
MGASRTIAVVAGLALGGLAGIEHTVGDVGAAAPQYSVGYFGLSHLTGVPYDKAHDGAWWRRWWGENKGRYPQAARSLRVPEPPKNPPARPAPDDPLADIADVPARELRAGSDEMKRYFLIGGGQAAPPAGGYGLLIVLPGGDGSADFHPFIRRMHKNVLKDRWLIAQAVAPKWDGAQFDRVVWPTASLPYPAARFTTEDFIRAIVAEVRAREKIDPRRVFLLGWSSGGPPCYAMATRPDSGVTGAFVAMSVFRPDDLPTIEAARGRAFYLLQSPEDRITPMRFAEAAERALQAAGAKVRLRRYEGGHGWHGDVWAMIGEGISWLDRQARAQ